MARKKVTFGAQPKAQPNIDEWVETREVVSNSNETQLEPTDMPEAAPITEKTTIPAAERPQPQEKIKRLTLDIPESLHRRIKGKAVMEGTTMVEMLRELLIETYQ